MLKTVIISLIAIVFITDADEPCYTAWGAPGRCVNIKQCEPLLKLLRPKPIVPVVIRVLRKAQCGFDGLDPKVCCQIVDNNENDGVISTPEPFVTSDRANEKPTVAPPSTTSSSIVPLDQHPNRHLLHDEQCGPIMEGRIYGGNVTSIYEFPWMSLLGYETEADVIEFRCGASLINERYVLTAAHCVTGLPEGMKLSVVRIGEHDLSRDRDCDSWENGVGTNCAEKYQEFGISRAHVHAEFSRHQMFNDIALVRLDAAVNLSPPNVRPICLPLGEAAALKSAQVVVTGWGSTESGARSQRLLKVELPIVDLDKCSLAYKYQGINIWRKQICAGGASGVDSCVGDSGGPLQVVDTYRGKPRYIIYGIVSFGSRSCGEQGIPGVYTNVFHYVEWILDTITE